MNKKKGHSSSSQRAAQSASQRTQAPSTTPVQSHSSHQNTAPAQSISPHQNTTPVQIDPPHQNTTPIPNPEPLQDTDDPIAFFAQREIDYIATFADAPIIPDPPKKQKEPLKIRIEEILHNDDNNTLIKLTNLTCKDFRDLIRLFIPSIELHHYKNTRVSMEARLLITLTWLKHAPGFEELADKFGIKKTHTRQIIIDVIDAIGSKIGREYVKWRSFIKWDDREKSKEYPYMLGALDATVQEIPRSANQEKYYSGKHKICCIKTQCFVSPKGFLLHYSKPIRGKRHDFHLFRKSNTLISKLKAEADKMKAEIDQIPVLLADSGYQGIHQIIPWALIPYKRRKNSELTAEQKTFNKKLSSSRIIVENYFSRLKQYWRVIGGKWPLHVDNDLTFYHKTFGMCAGLTNKLLYRRPLRKGAEKWDFLDLDSMDETTDAYNYTDSASESDSANLY